MENDCDEIRFLIEDDIWIRYIKKIKNGEFDIVKQILENKKYDNKIITELFGFILMHVFYFNNYDDSIRIAFYLLDKFESKIEMSKLVILHDWYRYLRFKDNLKRNSLLEILCKKRGIIENITDLDTMIHLCYNTKIDVTINHGNVKIEKLFSILRDHGCEKFKEFPIKTQLMYSGRSLKNLCALKLL
jgi:hypothetical protein